MDTHHRGASGQTQACNSEAEESFYTPDDQSVQSSFVDVAADDLALLSSQTAPDERGRSSSSPFDCSSQSETDDLSTTQVSDFSESFSNEDAVVQTQMLRYHFTDFPLDGLLWRYMGKGGWTYDATNCVYRAPLLPGQQEPLVLGNEQDTRRKLDSPTMVVPYVTNTLQLPPRTEDMDADEKLELSQQEIKYLPLLRANLIKRSFGSTEAGNRSGTDGDPKVASDDTVVDPADAGSRVRRSSTRAVIGLSSGKENNRLQQASVTAFEKGADLFIRRSRGSKRPRTRGNRKKGPSSTARADLEQSLTQAISNIPFPTRTECAAMFSSRPIENSVLAEKKHEHSFDEWKFLLSTRHSVLLYGVGSKQALLKKFAVQELESEGDVLVIDGFDHDVDIDALLDIIEVGFAEGENVSDNGRPLSSTQEDREVGTSKPSMLDSEEVVLRAARISSMLALRARREGQPLYLVIHNIDGPGLRGRSTQQALSALVVNSGIGHGINAVRMIASVDHVNSIAVLWDVATIANFSWVWKLVHTYRPYFDELTKGVVEDERRTSLKLRQKRSDDGDANVLVVLSSLAPRHAEVLQTLARLQRSSPSSGPIDHKVLREQCKQGMVTTSDSQLRSFLTELVDHGLVESERTSAREWVRIPHSVSMLHEILEFEIKRS